MKFGLPAVLLPFILFTGKSVFAQSKQEDSILFRSAILNTVSIYNKQLGDQSPIYNGSHYLAPGVEFKQGSPYFLVDSFTGNSSVVYDKIQFDSLNLLYEDLREFVVSKSSNFQMQLINQRITSFIISGHKFIRLVADSLNTGIEKTGF